MKYYKYVGTKKQAKEYGESSPIIGNIYSEQDIIGERVVGNWANNSFITVEKEWQYIGEDLEFTLGISTITTSNDKINPEHYKKGKVECIEAIESATVGKIGIEAACTANVIKYLWRYENKNGLEDVKKAQWYLNRLIKHLEEKDDGKH